MRISGSRVLLTGASGGIGHAIAKVLAARDASLVITGRRADVLSDLAGTTNAQTVAADLSDRNQVEELVKRLGDIDILVANAALPASGEITDYSVEQIDRALDVNLRAPILLGRAAAKVMAERGRGQIVFVSSLAGKVATARGSLYSATKFGLRGFALGLREDLQAQGVGVSVIYPGFIRDAGMFADSGATLPKGVGTSSPEEVAAAVVRAIEHNRGEITVAPVAMRVGTMFGVIAPRLASAVSRRMGAEKVAATLTEGQRGKR
jgi:short-subunit dehydrogenase